MQERVVVALAVADLTVAGLAGVSAPAAAGSGDPGWVCAGTPIYVCPSRLCGYVWLTQHDAWIPLECRQDSGTPWERWFKVLANPRWIQAFRVENSQPIWTESITVDFRARGLRSQFLSYQDRRSTRGSSDQAPARTKTELTHVNTMRRDNDHWLLSADPSSCQFIPTDNLGYTDSSFRCWG